MNKFIEIQNLSKVYQTIEKEIKALDNLNLEINKGEIVAIVGPSGCGKSTLLSIIAELDNDYYGKVVKDADIKTAYMLQSDALLPWLTIYENALLGLKIQDKLAPEYLEYVNYLFKFYNLEDFKNTYPDNISGGMKQRVG